MTVNNIQQIVKTLRTITGVDDPWELQEVQINFSKTGGYCEIKVGYHISQPTILGYHISVKGFGDTLELALKDLMENAEGDNNA